MASPKMFILVSLDFGGSTAVSLHAVTADEKAARDAYHELEGRYKENNEKGNNQGYSMLIELLESMRVAASSMRVCLPGGAHAVLEPGR